MKSFTFGKRGIAMLSLVASLFVGGTNAAFAQYEESFENGTNGWACKAESPNNVTSVGTDWGYVGTLSNYWLSPTYYQTGSSGLYSKDNEGSDFVVTPKLAAGKISLYAKSISGKNTDVIKVYTCDADGENRVQIWTEKGDQGNLPAKTMKQFSFNIEEDSHLAISLRGVAIDDFVAENGLAVAVEGPQLTVKDGGKKVKSPYDFDFGLATAGEKHEFVLANTGTEAFNVNVSETGNFGATLSATNIPVGGEVTLTVTMPATTANSVITISSEGIEPFVINVAGTVKDPSKVFIDFADGQMPAGWENVMIGSWGNGWEIGEGYARHASSGTSDYLAALTSPMMKFAEGEKLFFDVAKYGTSTFNTSKVVLETSTDGSNWTELYTVPADQFVYGEWKTQSVAMPAGSMYIRFNGGYACISNIYGGEYDSAAPDPTLTVSESDIDFGKVNAAAEKTFTVKSNVDTDVTVTIDGDNVFTVDAPATLKANQAATVTVKMNATANGEYAAVVTVKAGELTETVNVAGQFKAAGEKFYEDFESYATGKVKESDLPGWEKDLTETSSSSEYYGKLNFYDGNLYYYSVNDESVYVITPKLYVSGTDDVLTINDYYLKGSNVAKIAVSYSADKENWTQLKTLYHYDMVSSGSKTHTFTGVPEGNWFVKFELCDAALCDVEGFSTTLATATLNQAEAAALERGVQDVTLNYTIAEGKWGTIALPFAVEDLSVLGDVKAYAFTGYENGNIKLDVTTTMEAGKPYVIYANTAISEAIELNNVNITATEAAAVEFNGAKFQATYAPLAAGSMEGKYGVAPTGKIQKGSAKASMKGFRGFFELPANAQNARLLINGEEVTGIEAIENAESADVVFDLQGRRVAQPTKGLYIIGGKKMMVK